MDNSGTIDISKMSKAKVLAALYNNSKPQGRGFLHFEAAPMSEREASALLKDYTYFDYLKGRAMKVDLSGNHLDPYLYDRDNGQGAAAGVIENIE